MRDVYETTKRTLRSRPLTDGAHSSERAPTWVQVLRVGGLPGFSRLPIARLGVIPVIPFWWETQAVGETVETVPKDRICL